jgi:monoamine oxidase
MGTNAKVLMQFDHRPAHFRRWDGELTTDEPFLDTWDTSLTQSGAAGLITVYSGGAVGAGYEARRPHGPEPKPVVGDTLAALDRVVPGISRDFNGRAWLDDWVADPWVQGSYAAFLPGQSIKYYGVIARSEGGVHFAGEHTSVEYQGFFEGAVGSGQPARRRSSTPSAPAPDSNLSRQRHSATSCGPRRELRRRRQALRSSRRAGR